VERSEKEISGIYGRGKGKGWGEVGLFMKEGRERDKD